MDARDQLRRYLEQRRDAGESELVLDSMSVDEVMRVLGAGAVERPRHASTSSDAPSAGTARPREAPAAGDWRAALRAAGSTSPAASSAEAASTDAQRSTPPSMPRRDLERAPAPSTPALEAASPDSSLAASGAASGAAGGASDAPAEVVPIEQLPTGLVVGSPAHELFGGESPWRTLNDIAAAAGACQKCSLYKTAKQAVPGEGDPNAGFVCVGEAPGANEDEQGRPFVGQAGQLLTKILAAIHLSREEVFICNVLKHRPPGNRNPSPEEVAACSPYLVRQIELLQPRVILALGTFAAQTLLQTKEPIGKLRGRIHRYYGVPLIVTYHPAALLRNPSWKRPTWEDVQLARRLYDRARDA